MSKQKSATILLVSDGWEDAYIKDKQKNKVYYVRAPYFEKQGPISEKILHSSMAYQLIVPEESDFPTVDAAIEHVKHQYVEQCDNYISFDEAVDVILEFAKEINHPPVLTASKNVEKMREKAILSFISEIEMVRKDVESILATYASQD